MYWHIDQFPTLFFHSFPNESFRETFSYFSFLFPFFRLLKKRRKKRPNLRGATAPIAPLGLAMPLFLYMCPPPLLKPKKNKKHIFKKNMGLCDNNHNTASKSVINFLNLSHVAHTKLAALRKDVTTALVALPLQDNTHTHRQVQQV